MGVFVSTIVITPCRAMFDRLSLCKFPLCELRGRVVKALLETLEWNTYCIDVTRYLYLKSFRAHQSRDFFC